jgi:hypothetical protein
MATDRRYHRKTSKFCKKTLEDLMGIIPKESIEQMIGMSEAPRLPPPKSLAICQQQSYQKCDLHVINFAQPTNPDWTPLLPPDCRDSLNTIANKMWNLANVVTAGDSVMIWTDGSTLIGWDAKTAMKNAGAEGILTYQELGELQTIKKIVNITKTREIQVRTELKKLMRDLEASLKVLQGRKREMQSKMRAKQITISGQKRKRESEP